MSSRVIAIGAMLSAEGRQQNLVVGDDERSARRSHNATPLAGLRSPFRSRRRVRGGRIRRVVEPESNRRYDKGDERGKDDVGALASNVEAVHELVDALAICEQGGRNISLSRQVEHTSSRIGGVALGEEAELVTNR